jgi:hypothetical protein
VIKDVKEPRESFAVRQQKAAEKRAAALAKDAEQEPEVDGEAAKGRKNDVAKSQLQSPHTMNSANGLVKTPDRQLSMESQQNGSVNKVRSPTSDSRKSAGSNSKKSTRSRAR